MSIFNPSGLGRGPLAKQEDIPLGNVKEAGLGGRALISEEAERNTISPFLNSNPQVNEKKVKALNRVIPTLTYRKQKRLNLIQTHPQRERIEREIIARKPAGEIALRYGLSEAMVNYHKKRVLEPAMRMAMEVQGDEVTRKAQQYLDFVFGKMKRVVELAEIGEEGKPNLDTMLDALELGRKVARDQAELEGSIEPKGSKITIDQRNQVAPNGQVVMMPKTWESKGKGFVIPDGPTKKVEEKPRQELLPPVGGEKP